VDAQEIGREIFSSKIELKEIISLLKNLKEETFKILKEKINKWEKLIVEEFREERDKDFLEKDSGLVKHLWATPLHMLKNLVEIIEEKKRKENMKQNVII